MSVSLGKQKKRAKASQARKIDTQIPSAINVEDHVKARQFEIKALFKAIDTARTASSTRAFQSLPRHLRRRAASHNPKRVPLRLREKALAEISGDVSRLRRKRRKLLRTRMKKQQSSSSRTVNLQKRQLNKSWLETHIWHTKRMIMTNLWGYRIALHPTEKAFRPSVRAARQGCIVHDASYTSLIQIDGPQDAILRVFDSTLEKAGESASSKRYIFGTREMQSYIYEHKAYPTNIIAPVSLIWHAADGVRDKRSVWLRCHPSAFNEVHQSLHNAANELGDNALLIRDLRGHVNTFELYGPHSSQVLAGAFRLAKSNGKAQRIAWQKLSKAATPAHFPTGFVAGFNVEDPRLSFPPRNTKPDKAKAVADLTLSTTLASSLLYSEEERKKVAKPRFKKSQLDTRRSKTQQPGKALSMTPDDDTIPILVVQKRVEGGLHDSISGYTVIVPSGWGMQVWPSLTHTDARVGGIEQIEEFATQVGQTHFPASACPSSLVNYQECVRRANEEQERCNKRPKGKRPHYHSDLPLLPYLEKLREDEKEEGVKESGEKEGTAENGIKDGQLPTQPPQSQDISMDVEEETKPDAVNTNQWFLTNDLVRLVQDELKSGNSKNAQDALNGALQSLNVKKTVKLQDGLVQATMLPLKRGYARPCAYVYDDNETVGRISAATYAMNEGKAVAVVNMKAESYFDFYHSKSHLERVLTVMDNDDDTRRDYRLYCLK